MLPLVLRPLPLGAIKPSGWLRDQLVLEANGLAGHEHDFYPYVADSSWTGGGSEYSGLNEGFPYWLNGLVPLAYSLNDARLKDQVADAVTSVLSRQADDGWLGPETGRARNFWARYPLLLGMIQLVEAEPQTWEDPIVNATGRFVDLMVNMLRNDSSGYLWHEGDELSPEEFTWGRVRVQDLLIVLQWIWEREGTTEALRSKLAESMQILIDGSLNWADWWQEGVFIKEDLNLLDTEPGDGPRYPYEHGVNAGQGRSECSVFTPSPACNTHRELSIRFGACASDLVYACSQRVSSIPCILVLWKITYPCGSNCRRITREMFISSFANLRF